MDDRALRDRVRFLNYPKLPKVEGRMIDRVRGKREVRQAMLALLVKAGSENKEVPPDVGSVTAAGDEQLRDTIGDVGTWLMDNIIVDPKGELAADELWGALTAEFKIDSAEKVGGWTRTRILRRLAPELVDGWPKRAARRGAGGKISVYEGVRLRSLNDRREHRGLSRCFTSH